MGAHKLANLAGRLGTGLDGGADTANVAFDQRRDETAADLDAAREPDIGRFEHGVGRLDNADKPFGFDQA
jgi:hypothetical protein